MPSVPSSWDMPANSDGFFPRNEGDRLANKAGYFVWSHRIRKALGYCGLLDVVDGTLPEPTDAIQRTVWLKMDAAASVLITSCITGDLVIKITHAHTAKESWDLIAKEFSETSGSIIHWFRRLTKHMENGSDISTHIIAYQEAVRYLAHANFALPEWLAAAILLSTLPSDPNVPGSWDTFVNAAKMDKATMTLSSVVFDILEVKRGHESTIAVSLATPETLRAVDIKFCANCEKEGHIQEECAVITEETREIDAEEPTRSRSQTKAYRETLLAVRSEEYTRQKMEEKEKRRQTYAARKEAELAARKSEEEREIADAEERRLTEESVRKRQGEERLAEQRQERETERVALVEETRREAQREAEAEERLRSQARLIGGWRARMYTRSPNVTNAPLHESTKAAGSSGVVPEAKAWRPKRYRNRP